MNIEKLFLDKEFLNNELDFFIKKRQIKMIDKNQELVLSHIKKSRHNLAFFNLNKGHKGYNDWLIVTLYYALYHAALALITKKNYTSKNHYATILILIKEYTITKEEALLIDNLSINKKDAELYTNLKEDRHQASYLTDTKFGEKLIESYKLEVFNFINKVEDLINNK